MKRRKRMPVVALFAAGCCGFLFALAPARLAGASNRATVIPKWGRFERAFLSSYRYQNPLQDAQIEVLLVSPSGASNKVYGFWDGEKTWRVRYSPNELGPWRYETVCSDFSNRGLHGQRGTFLCTASRGHTRFEQHGPIFVSRDHHYLAHEDGTPFFWLGDTAWNGPLLSTWAEWDNYIRQRTRQKFNAIQWVATQWRASPDGDRTHQLAFVGTKKIEINPPFFQRLDGKIEALNAAGLLSVPVLLWAVNSGFNPSINPGVALPEDQAILLGRYLLARWGAYAVAWILAGDGDYRGLRAERWKRIGRAIFSGPHAPVMMHPGGMQWPLSEFQDETWLDVMGYQSGHGDDERTLRWMIEGPPATDWKKDPPRPWINLEPPYEFHIAYQSKSRITPEKVRRAIYWSLLGAPTAGITYGGHGVWGWDDGTRPPTDHPGTGVPLPLPEALRMPGAEQMAHLSKFFNAMEFWKLRPAPDMLFAQPGKESPSRFIAAARSEAGDFAVVYIPEDGSVELNQDRLPPRFAASWMNPRNGEGAPVVAVVSDNVLQFATPGEGDWLLMLRTEPTEKEE